MAKHKIPKPMQYFNLMLLKNGKILKNHNSYESRAALEINQVEGHSGEG